MNEIDHGCALLPSQIGIIIRNNIQDKTTIHSEKHCF